MIINSLRINEWRQFEKVSIDFHPKLTILTGSNGAGKSTLLKIISSALGQSEILIATPVFTKDRSFRYNSGVLKRKISLSKDDYEKNYNHIGSMSFNDGETCSLKVPKETGAAYNVLLFKEQGNYANQVGNIHGFKGVFIRSHRPITSYQQVGNIPTNVITAENAYSAYQQTINTFANNGYSQYSSTYRIKEAIISMATFGPGNLNVYGNEKINEIYNKFKSVLHEILPKEVGFRDISIRIPDVVLVTESGEFMLDSSSGGLMSLIDLAWQILLYTVDNPSCTVLLDEPENHLHPSMQRTVMVSLTNAFPDVQFIVATHSPFVVTSVKESYIYVLAYQQSRDNEDENKISRKIHSGLLGGTNKSATASETLRDVLGVPVTMPMWAEEEIDSIAKKISKHPFDNDTLNILRQELNASGLEEYFPSALNRLLEKQDD